MTGIVLVLVEHDRGRLDAMSLRALTAARRLADGGGDALHALTVGVDADDLAAELGAYGAIVAHQVHDDLLYDYGPELWGAVVAGAVEALAPTAFVAAGTDRGNEVLAHAAARLDLPLATNCTQVEGNGLTRLRWGGSLLEQATIDAPTRLLTIAPLSVDPLPADTPATVTPQRLEVELDAVLARTTIRDRVEREAGVTLATAPVVIGGGRGVGSADGFAPLEELAAALGGVVGCSRAVTNNGWRNHTDQVGQTGTRISPAIYLACGISGAIQHWVGAAASKQILAINTDPEANMVTKADYAVIGDLHEVVPAITAEIERRRG